MTTTVTTYRLFSYRMGQVGERLATAKTLQNGTVLQVYPVKSEFETLEAWKAAWPQCEVLKEESKLVKHRDKKPSVALRRRNQEVMEFFDTDYTDLFKKLEVVSFPEPYVQFETHDGAKWSIYRSLNFLEAPKVWKNGERYCNSFDDENYSPALTAVRWWMMLAFTTPE